VDANNNLALTWNDNDIQDNVHGLKSLTFSDFEAVDLTPIVTGLGTSSAPAGTTLTITGQNFSGAAGHLQVLFGSNLATNVQVLDDGHVTAVVPPGSGTVDVRVQSGVNDAGDSQNSKAPVFGYGTSAITTADRFTYGTAGPDPIVQFVTLAYNDLLNRPPDAAGLASWVGQIKSGTPRSAIATALTHSAEYFGTIISASYQQFLGRSPDAAGLSYWIGRMQNGLSDEHLQAGFIASPEYYLHAGNTDKAWVDALYLNLLGRPADGAGESYWIKQLAAGVARSAIAYGFAASAEEEGIRVQGDYRHLLLRSASPSEESYWVGQFLQGVRNEDVIAGIVGSEEYFRRAGGP
jgi:hypothetical protein